MKWGRPLIVVLVNGSATPLQLRGSYLSARSEAGGANRRHGKERFRPPELHRLEAMLMLADGQRERYGSTKVLIGEIQRDDHD
jgi:hypothetical protein